MARSSEIPCSLDRPGDIILQACFPSFFFDSLVTISRELSRRILGLRGRELGESKQCESVNIHAVNTLGRQPMLFPISEFSHLGPFLDLCFSS